MGLCSGAEREFAYPANGPTTKWSEYGWVVVSTGSHNSVHGRMSADGMVRPCSRPSSARSLRRGSEDKGATPMSENLNSAIAVIGIDIGKNSFHLVGQDRRGSIVLRQKWSRGQVEASLATRADIHEGPEHMLQSEAGYIDASPHRQDRRNLLHRTAGPYIGVMTRKAHVEQSLRRPIRGASVNARGLPARPDRPRCAAGSRPAHGAQR